MPRVWVSVGSNIDRERHIRGALDDLRGLFGELEVSPVYESAAVGFDGDAFFNLVVGFDTELPPERVRGLLRAVEARHGRERNDQKFAARTLDLDLLTYGDAVVGDGGHALPREEIERYAFVLGPLADVAGGQIHPQRGLSFAEMWRRFDPEGRRTLRRIPDGAWMHDPDGEDP